LLLLPCDLRAFEFGLLCLLLRKSAVPLANSSAFILSISSLARFFFSSLSSSSPAATVARRARPRPSPSSEREAHGNDRGMRPAAVPDGWVPEKLAAERDKIKDTSTYCSGMYTFRRNGAVYLINAFNARQITRLVDVGWLAFRDPEVAAGKKRKKAAAASPATGSKNKKKKKKKTVDKPRVVHDDDSD
jgi:hypothetical protein